MGREEAENGLPTSEAELNVQPDEHVPKTTENDLIETIRRFFPGVEVVEEDNVTFIREV